MLKGVIYKFRTATPRVVVFLLLMSGAYSALATPAKPACVAGKQQPVWVSRCYDGEVTLGNYTTPESLKHRLQSNLAWIALEGLVGFQRQSTGGQVVSGSQVLGLTMFLMSGGHLGWAHDVTSDASDIRFTGPVIQGAGFDTHQRVRLFYSDQVVSWLQNDRQGKIADGAVIVKQMYASDPNEVTYGADRVSGWAVMIKNSRLSHDGWIWYLFFSRIHRLMTLPYPWCMRRQGTASASPVTVLLITRNSLSRPWKI